MPTLDFIRDCAEDTAKRNYQKGYQDGYANAIEENLRGTTLALYSILNSNRPNMYDLINNNISVRGIRTGNPLEADIIYTSAKDLADDLKEQGQLKENVKIITPYDIDEFYALL